MKGHLTRWSVWCSGVKYFLFRSHVTYLDKSSRENENVTEDDGSVEGGRDGDQSCAAEDLHGDNLLQWVECDENTCTGVSQRVGVSKVLDWQGTQQEEVRMFMVSQEGSSTISFSVNNSTLQPDASPPQVCHSFTCTVWLTDWLSVWAIVYFFLQDQPPSDSQDHYGNQDRGTLKHVPLPEVSCRIATQGPPRPPPPRLPTPTHSIQGKIHSLHCRTCFTSSTLDVSWWILLCLFAVSSSSSSNQQPAAPPADHNRKSPPVRQL